MFLLLFGHSAAAETVLITASGYIDVDRGRLVTQAVVLVEDGRIRAVNPARPPTADRSIDLGERILLPGLMDLLDPTVLPPRKRAKAEYVMPRAKESLRKAIAAGVKVAVGTDAPILPTARTPTRSP